MSTGRRVGRLLKGFWEGWLRPVLPFIFIMLCFRSAVADWNDVPTGSMRPTIVEGDQVKVGFDGY